MLAGVGQVEIMQEVMEGFIHIQLKRIRGEEFCEFFHSFSPSECESGYLGGKRKAS